MHNPLAKIAIELKEAGFNQALTLTNYIYLLNAKDYIRFSGQVIEDEYVKVPDLASLVSGLSDVKYSVHHDYIDFNGKMVEEYSVIDDKGNIIKSNLLWECLAKLWISKKGK